jgi:uncharacterized protein YpuA (DUF1002 family)
VARRVLLTASRHVERVTKMIRLKAAAIFAAIKHELATDYEAVDAWQQVVKNLMQNADAELPQ